MVDSTGKEEEGVVLILRSAGLESSPIDPSSLDALRDLVREYERARLEEDDRKPSAKPPPVASASTEEVKPSASAIAALSPSSPRPPSPPLRDEPSPPLRHIDRKFARAPSELTASGFTNLSTASIAGLSKDREDRIMEQLEFQSSILLDMQRKLEYLTERVEQLEGGEQEFPKKITRKKLDKESALFRPRPTRALENLQNVQQIPQLEVQPEIPRREPQVVEPRVPQQEARPLLEILLAPIIAPFNFIIQSRLVQIIRLFWTQSQGFVRPIDGGLIFKIVFMMVVITARIQRRNEQALNSPKFAFSIMFIFIGFLYHTKWLQFIWKFCVEDQVPARVWLRRPLRDPIPPLQPQRALLPNQRALPANNNGDENNDDNGNNNLGWRHTFLGGIIIPRPDQNPIFAVIQDVFYLLGSFVFSIFPMWRPEGRQRPQDLEPVEHPQEQERQPFLPDQEQQGRAFLPHVAPPRDVMEPDDDDDEEEEDEEILRRDGTGNDDHADDSGRN